jgi:DNA-binding response OmpR family regulator
MLLATIGQRVYASSDRWPWLNAEAAQRDNQVMSRLVLVVEDDPSLREVIRLGLEGEGFKVTDAPDGPSALIAFASQKPDLVLLDVMLPGLDGFAVCRELRKISLAPIVMLTARTSTADIVTGLESGADDYVTKPFEFPELTARVRSALRRATTPAVGEEPARDEAVSGCGAGASTTAGAGASPATPAPLTLGPLTIDPGAYLVRRGTADIPLTATEFRLLYEFARHAGQVLTRDQLLELVWGYTYLGDSRLVDVHVQRLRAKIEDDASRPLLVLTVRGVGYRASRDEIA